MYPLKDGGEILENEIEEKVDLLLSGKEKEEKASKHFFKRKLMGLPIGLIVILVAGLVIASLIGYVMVVDISGSKSPVLQSRESQDDGSTWGEWADGEELSFSWDFGDVVEYQGSRLYQIQTTAEYDAEYSSDVTVTFVITNLNDALTVIDTSDDSIITDGMTKTVSQTTGFEFEVSIDIGLWTFSGYDYGDLEVKVLPVV